MQFIFGSELAHSVVNLVSTSQKMLLLVSPYYDPWDHLATEIENAVAVRKVSTRLIIRGGDDRAKQEPNTERARRAGAQVMFLSRLHAKLYLNESEAILTSMNLLKSSAFGSWEMAVRLTRAEDGEQFRALGESVAKLIQHVRDEEERNKAINNANAPDPFLELGRDAQTSVSIQVSTRSQGERKMRAEAARAGSAGPPNRTPSPRPADARPADARPADARPAATGRQPAVKPSTGHCIRCGEQVPLDVEKPYCPSDFKSWSKYENPEYGEKLCHKCGNPNSSTMKKPICLACYRTGVGR